MAVEDLTKEELERAEALSEQRRAQAEQRAEELAMLLLALYSGESSESEVGEVIRRKARSVVNAAALAALAGIVVARRSDTRVRDDRMPNTDPRAGVLFPESDAEITEAIERVTEETISRTAQVVQTRSGETLRTPEEMSARRLWAKTVGRSIATQAHSLVAMELAPVISEQLSIALGKIWMSRGDSRVRSQHRLLHARTRPIEEPFWKNSLGEEMYYPGDIRGPISNWINCRCNMMLVPLADRLQAHNLFHMEDDDFALTASAVCSQHEDIAAISDLVVLSTRK